MSDSRSRLERRSIRLLEAAGYECIRLSLGLGFHFLAIGRIDLALVRVTRDSLTAEETEDLRSFVTPANVRKLVHVWERRERLPNTISL